MGQARYTKLGQLGFTGAEQDRYLKWLRSLGATAFDIPTAERQALSTAGTIRLSNNDIRAAYFRNLGYTGSLTDLENNHWINLSTSSFTPIENIFAELDPAILNSSYTFNAQPTVVIPTQSRVANGATTYSSVPSLMNISEAGEIWYDGNYRFRKTTFSGVPCIELSHHASDPTYFSGIRSEIDFFYTTPANLLFPYKEVFWDSANICLPDRAAGDPSKLIWQWHQSGPTTNPFFSLSQNGNNLLVEIRYNDQASPTQATNVVFSSNIAVLPPAGQFFTITVHAKCSHLLADNPFIKIYLNDTLVLDRTGTNGRCGYNQSATRFHRWGFYAWQGLTAGTYRKFLIGKAVRAREPAVGSYTVADLRHYVGAI